MNALSHDKWVRLCQAVGATGDLIPCFVKLTAAYSEPHRHYHNLRHIVECQQEFETARDLATSPEAIELAIWFHDAIYDTKATDNEEKSAAWAVEFLEGAGVAGSIVEKVSNLVLATKNHDVSLDEDAPILVDVDLSILGQPQQRFWEYETQIREEYSWVEEDLFAEKRGEILTAFLERERIFSTDLFYRRYELQARRNIQTSVAKLLW
jgi:predicted metal-dependent HD superfamily phosphohydrolase